MKLFKKIHNWIVRKTSGINQTRQKPIDWQFKQV
jgi:hypothetical protein